MWVGVGVRVGVGVTVGDALGVGAGVLAPGPMIDAGQLNAAIVNAAIAEAYRVVTGGRPRCTLLPWH